MSLMLSAFGQLRAADPLLDLVRPGMVQLEIAPLLSARFSRFTLDSPTVGAPFAKCWRIDDRRSIIVEWEDAKMALKSPASAVRIVDFADLCRPLAGDALDDVLAVHAAPTAGESVHGFRGDVLLASASRLHRAGRLRTLIAMRSYLEIIEAHTEHGSDADRRHLWEADGATDRIAWLARLLFTPHDQAVSWATPQLGTPDPRASGPIWSLYPLAVSNGLPFLVTAHYWLAGGQAAEPPVRWIDFCDHQCDWLAELPVPSGDPTTAADALIGRDWLKAAFTPQVMPYVTRIIRQQAYAMRRAIAPVGGWAATCSGTL
jgi:hypothetical protein